MTARGSRAGRARRAPGRGARARPERLVRRGRHRSPAEPIDPLDVAILSVLQADGRASLRRVAKAVGASVTTVSTRVRMLERTGVLQGFVPLVSVQRLAALGRSPHCVVLRIVPRPAAEGGLDGTARAIAEEPSVCYLFQMGNSPELLALASTVSPRATDRLIGTIARLPGVERVEPMPIARVHKERPNHPVGMPIGAPSPPRALSAA